MALLYIDGFDHYTNATGSGNRLYEIAPAYWSGVSGEENDDHFVTSPMPELGTRGLQFRLGSGSSISSAVSMRNLLAPPKLLVSGETLGIGFHFYLEDLPNTAHKGGLVGFGDASQTYRMVRVDTSGVLHYWSGSTSTGDSLVNSGVLISPEVLYHLEVFTYLHASEGSIEVRLNGVTVINEDNLNTLPTELPFIKLAIAKEASPTGGASQTAKIFYDNLYMWDSEGPFNNDFLGERNVMTVPVASDEVPQDWSLSSGSDAYDLLDNVPPDPLNDYIESTAANEVSKFGIATLDSMEISVVGIQTTVQAYKTGTSDTEIDIGVDSGSVLDVGTRSLTQDQPTYVHHISEVNPDTSEPYTPAETQSALVHIERSL